MESELASNENEVTVDQRSVRINKLEELRKAGINPFPYKFEVSHRSEQIKENFDALEKSEERVLSQAE